MQRIIYGALIFICLFLTGGTLLQSGIPYGHDTYAHATYSRLMIQSLSEGQFPVRWIEHVWIGYGQPLFNFYQVGFFYFVALTHTVIPQITLSINITVLLLWWVGTTFTYVFTLKYGKIPALTAAIIYLFSPYLILDIFVRTSFPEFTALSLIPGVLWTLDRLIQAPTLRRVIPLALLSSIILISHLPTFVIFSPILGLYALTQLYKNPRYTKAFIYATVSEILALAIAAFYVLPALTELSHIQIRLMQTGYFNYDRHFINPLFVQNLLWGYGGGWWGEIHSLSAGVGITQWSLAILGIVISIIPLKKFRNKSQLRFWTFVILYAFFFMNSISRELWHAIPIFSFFQFPWRFFMLVPVATATIGAILLHNLQTQKYQHIALIGIFLLQVICVYPFMRPQEYLNLHYFNLPYNEWRNHPQTRYVAFFEPAYSPLGIPNTPQKDEFNTAWSISNWDTQIIEHQTRNHEITLRIKAPSATTLVVHKPYYPQWKAYIDGEAVTILKSDLYNFMLISIPQGEHQLEVRFESSSYMKIGNSISIIGLCLIFILTVVAFLPQKTRR